MLLSSDTCRLEENSVKWMGHKASSNRKLTRMESIKQLKLKPPKACDMMIILVLKEFSHVLFCSKEIMCLL